MKKLNKKNLGVTEKTADGRQKKMEMLMQNEIERAAALERARKFAVTVIEQCQQQDFTLAQFGEFVDHLDRRRQYLNSHVNEVIKMTDVFDHRKDTYY